LHKTGLRIKSPGLNRYAVCMAHTSVDKGRDVPVTALLR